MSEPAVALSFDPDTIWNALPSDEERAQACLLFWEVNDPLVVQARARAGEILSRIRHYREKFFHSLSSGKKAAILLLAVRHHELRPYLDDVIRAWLMGTRLQLIEAFLNGAGIAHNSGVIEDEPPPSADSLETSVEILRKGYPDRDIAVYFAYVLSFSAGRFWDALPQALESAGFHLAAALGIESAEPQAGEEPAGEEDLEPDAATPQSTKFTTLDNTLIRQLVASACGETGALTEEEAEDLIEEIIDLNAARHHTRFHRGFLHALFKRDFQFHTLGENSDRRIWYLTGVVFGLLRSNAIDQTVSILRSETELVDLLVQSKARCGTMLLPELYGPLVEHGMPDLAIALVDHHAGGLAPLARWRILTRLHGDGARFLAEGRTAEARQFFRCVDRAIERERVIPDELVDELRTRNERKRAQLLQAEGDFTRSKTLLEEALSKHTFSEAPNAHADLGLIKGGFRNLAAALPQSDEAQKLTTLRLSLEKGRKEFEKAVAEHQENATNAHLCLGIIGVLTGDDMNQAQMAADHLRTALSGMTSQRVRYQAIGAIDCAQCLLALSLLETAEESNFRPASDLVQQAIESGTHLPVPLWRRLLEAAAVFDDQQLAARIARHLLTERGPSQFEAIAPAGVIGTNSELRSEYLDWLDTVERPLGDRWNALEKSLPEALKESTMTNAKRILDQMDELASNERTFRKAFLKRLDKLASFSPAWSREEADDVRIRLLELEDRLDEATGIHTERFLRLWQHRSDRYKRFEAYQVLDELRAYPGTSDTVARFESMIGEASDGADEDRTGIELLKDGAKVRVTFVGGNETQARYREDIHRTIGKLYPGLKVELYFPGWGSNWNRHLERVRESIAESDGVVLHRFVRTLFGEHVRRMCSEDCPWFPCISTGKDSIIRAIIQSAAWAAERQRAGSAKPHSQQLA